MDDNCCNNPQKKLCLKCNFSVNNNPFGLAPRCHWKRTNSREIGLNFSEAKKHSRCGAEKTGLMWLHYLTSASKSNCGLVENTFEIKYNWVLCAWSCLLVFVCTVASETWFYFIILFILKWIKWQKFRKFSFTKVFRFYKIVVRCSLNFSWPYWFDWMG